MTQRHDALTKLVMQHVGADRTWSTREFAEIAIDPDSGWSPSKSLVAKIINGEGYSVDHKLVGAIAAGLRIPRPVAAAAAHMQLIGYDEEELREGPPAVVLKKIGAHTGEPEKRAAKRVSGEPAGACE